MTHQTELRYIRIISKHKPDIFISQRLNITIRKVRCFRQELGIKNKTGRKRKFDFTVVPAIEDYANGMTIADAGRKHNIVWTKLSRYASHMLYKKLSDETKVITLPSKV